MQQTIEHRVTQVVKDVLEIDEGTNILNASIEKELAPTSIDQMTLFIALEDEFQESIPPQEVAGIDTIRDIARYIEEKLNSMS
ncbi:MAG: phosphopantetheine-binding protein [Arenicellales bacterium]|nr:phosphopantetheine-binding protein [Arenicellales bacterium]